MFFLYLFDGKRANICVVRRVIKEFRRFVAPRFTARDSLCTSLGDFTLLMRQSNRNFNSPPPPCGKPRSFELLKIGSFEFRPPRVKMLFKCPTLSSHFLCQMPLLKNNCRRFLSFVIKLVYIRGTQRHQFKRESYFRRWLRGTLYALRTRNTGIN